MMIVPELLLDDLDPATTLGLAPTRYQPGAVKAAPMLDSPPAGSLERRSHDRPSRESKIACA
jgi:hypothetical protein